MDCRPGNDARERATLSIKAMDAKGSAILALAGVEEFGVGTELRRLGAAAL
jgi:hypothetical protein